MQIINIFEFSTNLDTNISKIAYIRMKTETNTETYAQSDSNNIQTMKAFKFNI